MKAVVILPTYNERENIVPMLEKLTRVTRKIPGYSFVFLVADDASPDGTAEAVEAYRGKRKDIMIVSGKKEGLGKALLRGLTYATTKLGADVFVQIDADLSHDPAALPKFFEAIDKGADFVIGSRYIPGGSIPENWGVHRKIYSIVGNAFVRLGLGYLAIYDWTGGYRAYQRKFFDRLKGEVAQYSGYLYQIAFLNKSIKSGAHVVEVPIHFTDRMYGHSKIAPSEYIRDIIVYVIRERLTSIVKGSFGKFLVVGTIGYIVNASFLEIFSRMNVPEWIAWGGSTELAIISNFTLNNIWTFKANQISGWEKILTKFIQFNGTSSGALLIQTVLGTLGVTMFGSQYRQVLLPFIVVFVVLPYNYLMYTRIIWRTKNARV